MGTVWEIATVRLVALLLASYNSKPNCRSSWTIKINSATLYVLMRAWKIEDPYPLDLCSEHVTIAPLGHWFVYLQSSALNIICVDKETKNTRRISFGSLVWAMSIMDHLISQTRPDPSKRKNLPNLTNTWARIGSKFTLCLGHFFFIWNPTWPNHVSYRARTKKSSPVRSGRVRVEENNTDIFTWADKWSDIDWYVYNLLLRTWTWEQWIFIKFEILPGYE